MADGAEERKEERTLLLLGDSNTWGYCPLESKRLPPDVRWAGRLQAALPAACKDAPFTPTVVVEGLNGRTTAFPVEGAPCEKAALPVLPTLLHTHKPLHTVVIALGVNDLKKQLATEVADGMRALLRCVTDSCSDTGEHWAAPHVVILCPPPIPKVTPKLSAWEFREEAAEESVKLQEAYKAVAAEFNAGIVMLADVAAPSDADYIHFEADAHAAIADAVLAALASTFLNPDV